MSYSVEVLKREIDKHKHSLEMWNTAPSWLHEKSKERAVEYHIRKIANLELGIKTLKKSVFFR